MPGYTPNVTVTGPVINGKTIANTSIFNVESGTQKFIPTSFHFETVSYTAGTLNTPPTLSVGTNSPNYDNLLKTTDLSTLLGNVLSFVGMVQGKNVTEANSVPALAPGSTIYCRVSVVTGANAYTFRVDTQGYYV